MGNGPSKINDLFYPDNPKRRERAEELEHDIKSLNKEFNDLKAKIDEQSKSMEEKLTKFLHSQGYNSIDELDESVQRILNGKDLEDWRELKKNLKVDVFVEKLTFTISGLITIATGVFSAGLWIFGIIPGATAVAAIEAVGAALAVVAVGFIVFEAIQGAQERARLEEAIRKLAFARVDAKQQLKTLMVYARWLTELGYNYCPVP
ncbi:hypothetical protein K440DRAFT_640888 [Wilcoxina mikolae CBS 423.85]|nr:hypothetical protein K440DRAFT_640888 [Wilcoxina mikolae CBS 423.85]